MKKKEKYKTKMATVRSVYFNDEWLHVAIGQLSRMDDRAKSQIDGWIVIAS